MVIQATFAELEYGAKKKKTRREKFLERMDGLIPWKELEDVIEPYYPKGSGRGRRPYPLSAMLRVHCVQLFYNLSDPGMEDMLYEVEPVRRFAGLTLDALPDETTNPEVPTPVGEVRARGAADGVDQRLSGVAGSDASRGHGGGREHRGGAVLDEEPGWEAGPRRCIRRGRGSSGTSG